MDCALEEPFAVSLSIDEVSSEWRAEGCCGWASSKQINMHTHAKWYQQEAQEAVVCPRQTVETRFNARRTMLRIIAEINKFCH